jgi:predicted DNA-binding transcriptional regulator AlpA
VNDAGALGQAILDLIDARIEQAVDGAVERVLAGLAPSETGERLLRLSDAAARAGVSVATLNRWIADDQLQAVQIPGRVAGKTERRIRQADLDALIRRLASSPGRRTNITRRSAATRTRRSKAGGPKSLTQLVQERLSRSANKPARTAPSTTSAQVRA